MLENANSNVISWLSNDDISSVKDLIHITNAYIVRSSKVKLPLRFFELVELTALKLSTQMSASEAVTLLNLLANEASTELIEVFDRIIGKKVDDLKP